MAVRDPELVCRILDNLPIAIVRLREDNGQPFKTYERGFPVGRLEVGLQRTCHSNPGLYSAFGNLQQCFWVAYTGLRACLSHTVLHSRQLMQPAQLGGFCSCIRSSSSLAHLGS